MPGSCTVIEGSVQDTWKRHVRAGVEISHKLPGIESFEENTLLKFLG